MMNNNTVNNCTIQFDEYIVYTRVHNTQEIYKKKKKKNKIIKQTIVNYFYNTINFNTLNNSLFFFFFFCSQIKSTTASLSPAFPKHCLIFYFLYYIYIYLFIYFFPCIYFKLYRTFTRFHVALSRGCFSPARFLYLILHYTLSQRRHIISTYIYECIYKAYICLQRGALKGPLNLTGSFEHVVKHVGREIWKMKKNYPVAMRTRT